MDKQIAIRDEMPINELGTVLVKSGFFADTREISQAIVKVMAGRELGFGPIASMTGINIIKGRVALSANIMASAVKRSGRYTFRVREISQQAAEIEFFERDGDKWASLGISRFTLEDAKRAGTQNMDKFPRNMLYARAMSNGVKWYCPDVTGGPAYTPEEMGATVDEDGNVVSAPAVKPIVTVEQTPVELPTAPAPKTNGNGNGHTNGNGKASAKLIGINGQHAHEWQRLCVELAGTFPEFADKQGAPNGFHILGSAYKCGFTEVTPSNMQSVIEAIAARHTAPDSVPVEADTETIPL